MTRSLFLLALIACSGGETTDATDATDATDGTTDTGTVVDTDTTDTDTTDTDTTGAACVPIEDAFETNAVPVLEAKCWDCHGETPSYGAPYALTDYDDLIAGVEGDRKVDKIVERLVDFTMPPSNAAPLTHNELDTLVGWASCGLVHPTEPDGLQVNRSVWQAPAYPPADAVPIELTAVDEVVGPTVLDDYRTFQFSNIVPTSLFIARIEPIIDDARVLHHITLTHAPLGFPYLYAWAPGTNPIQFPDGGIELAPNDTLNVEIHYNNGAGVTDAVDSSGVRLWVIEEANVEYGMMSPQSWNIFVPAGGTDTAEQSCTAPFDFEIVAGMPHMHEIGDTFVHDVERGDGTVDNLIELSGWSFESQFFYEMGVQVNAGDTLRMTCGYDNYKTYPVSAGLGTGDEMCFDFLVVTPPEASTLCLSPF